ncbi:hypothetical protein FHS43_002793 [Streptosporangium becharense]|uniref:Uncharacterized protein n=1 Tax=Streptosporangium becharense TaxID=1816182 RepID=A0A7W9IL29_9ACTN|nr:hypothetical protein [Streptosporangium becharense]MBB2911520.1 hypothetical protein [Streptosporangium becharense]MBB5822662.1 hypothetical protein [Streptosporangium becharense]
MLDTLSCLERFVAAVRHHADLTVQRLSFGDPAYVCVRNRFSSTLMETVTCSQDGGFITSWGYRLGSADNVEDAAARLAFLLAALPSRG